jgi:hypothetical protein
MTPLEQNLSYEFDLNLPLMPHPYLSVEVMEFYVEVFIITLMKKL